MGLVPPLLIRPRRKTTELKCEHPSTYSPNADQKVFGVCQKCVEMQERHPELLIQPFYDLALGHRCPFPSPATPGYFPFQSIDVSKLPISPLTGLPYDPDLIGRQSLTTPIKDLPISPFTGLAYDPEWGYLRFGDGQPKRWIPSGFGSDVSDPPRGGSVIARPPVPRVDPRLIGDDER